MISLFKNLISYNLVVKTMGNALLLVISCSLYDIGYMIWLASWPYDKILFLI